MSATKYPPGVPPGVPDPSPKTESPWPAGWELVHEEAGDDRVRRIRVFGGWLYQVENYGWSESTRQGESGLSHYGWHPPVFVPEGTRIVVGGGNR